jgi:hypothetical protein
MRPAKDIFLILVCISFIIVIGAAVYEHMGVVPQWSEAPPKSLSMFQGEYGLNSGRFWMSIHPVTLLLFIIALVTNWKTFRRRNILIAFIGYLIILAITSVYFVPTLMEFINTPYSDTVDPTLVDRASMWETLSLVRLVALLVLAYILLSALLKSGEIILVRPVTTDVPLTYPNDALGG